MSEAPNSFDAPAKRNTSVENDDSLDDFAPKPVITPINRTQGAPPAQTIARTEEKVRVAKLAEESGFTINNFDEKPIPARIASAANTFLKTVRLQVADWNRFQVWCHENGYTHWKGFHILTSALPPKKS